MKAIKLNFHALLMIRFSIIYPVRVLLHIIELISTVSVFEGKRLREYYHRRLNTKTIIFNLAGLGIAMVITSLLISIYYNVVIAWSISYLYNSLTLEVPWKSCGNFWNTATCR